MKKIAEYRKLIGLAAAALVMTAALTLEGASAYFTTYVSAGGSHVVNLGSTTELKEDVSDMTKHISIENTSLINDCFVRVKVFYGAESGIKVAYKNEAGDWYEGKDDYWYYRPILPAGQKTSTLDVKIDVPTEFDKENFNVVVIQECTPVVYDKNGEATADWTTVYSGYQEEGATGK